MLPSDVRPPARSAPHKRRKPAPQPPPVSIRDSGVQSDANRARPTPRRSVTPRRAAPPRSGVFGPVRRADAPITAARRQAHRRVQQATKKVERRVVVPYVPKINNPTPAQRQAAHDAARKTYLQGIHTRGQINALPPEQRKRVNRALGYLQTQRRNLQISVATNQPKPTPLPPGYKLEGGTIWQHARNPYTGEMEWLPADSFEGAGASGRAVQRGARQYQANVVDPLRRAFYDRLEHIQTHVPAAQQPRAIRHLVAQFTGPKARHPRRELAARGREIARARRSELTPGHHTRVQALGLNLDLSNVGDALASVTSLDRGDLGPREFLAGAAGDVKALGTAPFIGAYELGAGGYEAAAHGDTKRLETLARGTIQGLEQGFAGQLVQGHWDQALEQLRTHPVFAGLDVAAGVGAAGRAAGALARGAGARASAGGVRGALARLGSTTRPPLALSDDASAAAAGLLRERTYSKDLSRKAAQVAADRRREPLLDAHGRVVTVEQRGRQVPVLKATARERERLLRRRGDLVASRANVRERLAREEAGRGESRSKASRNPRDARLANELVSMVLEGTLRSPKTFEADLRRHLAALDEAVKRGGFRHSVEVQANRERAKFVRKVLGSRRALRQAEIVFSAAREQAAHLNAREAEAIALGLLDPAKARRAKLIPWAIEHMGARHVSVDEHAHLERQARTLEAAARDAARELPTGHPERAALGAHARQLRRERLLVSGRDPKRVLAHEQAQAGHAAAKLRAQQARAEVARLERSRQRVLGSNPSAQRARVLAAVDHKLEAARRRAQTAGEAERVARHRAETTPLPEIREAVRINGRYLSNEAIEAEILRHRGDLDSIAYLPHRLDVRGARAHHTQFRPGTRPTLDKETRTGEAYRRGSTAFGRELVHDEFSRKAIQIAKAEQLDRFVAEHGRRHPAWAKRESGAKLSPAERRIVERGGYFTAREALEVADRLEADTGEAFTAVRAHGAKVSAETRRMIQEELQQPRAFESLGQRLLNDRIIDPAHAGDVDTRARNVVLVPTALVDRLGKHLEPAGDIVRFLQYVNRAFRSAVLPQPRWLTGNFIEPFLVRLPTVGSGVNVLGLGLDVRAAVKVVRRMERSADPKIRQAAKELRAQHLGGLLIGGRGATVRRTAEDLPGALKTGAIVRQLPVVKQLTDLAGGILNGYFRINQVIEGAAQRAALGHSIREDLHAFTGSWWSTVKLGQEAADEAARGLVNTSTQERFLRAQHELLGKYEGFSPQLRTVIQSGMPFLPWALNAARFTMWTMPAHHTVLTDVLVKTEQTVDQAWQEHHDGVPPGGLELALPRSDGGWVDVARYTPWGFSGPMLAGDLQVATDQAFPQFSGAMAALEGRDPFGRELRLSDGSTPSGGQRALIGLYQGLEALVPFLSTARRLQEHGETAAADSTVWAPKTKEGTSHGMSAVRRTFDPFRPVYLRSGGPSAANVKIDPRSPAAVLARSRGHVTSTGASADAQAILRRSHGHFDAGEVESGAQQILARSRGG